MSAFVYTKLAHKIGKQITLIVSIIVIKWLDAWVLKVAKQTKT